jgi:predicted RNA binding protein YcfA (HicA-like mRNA interferase family)
MTPTHVRFAELRQLLLDLGFQEQQRKDGHFRFRHAASDTVFLFRPYRPDDHVILVHYRMVQRILDERGLMEADQFDRLLNRAPA